MGARDTAGSMAFQELSVETVLPSDGSTLSRAVRRMLAGEDGEFTSQSPSSHLAMTCP